MRHLVLSTVVLAILASGVWAQAGMQAQTPTTTTPGLAAPERKTESKSGKHHHHHKHHHKKQAGQQ